MSNVPEKKPDSTYIFWTSPEDLPKAIAESANNFDSYDGIMSSSASRRSYLDIEPNISVRTDFTKDDYYRFRPLEEPGTTFKQSMAMCMRAYDKVGIIKNVIDLMGDFASQGITLHHKNKKIQKFFRKWWEKVQGTERSERFLNMLYRCGNVIIHKRYAKINAKTKQEMTTGSDLVDIAKPIITKKEIPFRYDFLNPLSIEIISGYAGAFSGKCKYVMKIAPTIKSGFDKDPELLNSLPSYIKDAIKSGSTTIDLNPEIIEVFFYKKDDWNLWAYPMISSIIDDIVMLEKMKLADMSALDGAISNVRLWRLGSLEHKILPNRTAIDKLRNILASNVGGGTMDLVWGPEIDYKESATQIYRFLGTEKYQPVLNSIYAGLGIPPTLTGLAGQNGGFTNNFISLKTLIERLEYGRDLLKQFWKKELAHVAKAMGFDSPPILHFNHMLLSDEAAERNLLIQLADRDIISVETLRSRFGELNDIEEFRLRDEQNKRMKNKIPNKADPFHNGNIESEYLKIALQKGDIAIDDVTDVKPTPKPVEQQEPNPQQNPQQIQNPKVPKDNGRPPFVKDSEPRKQKRVLPKDTPTLSTLMIWTQNAQNSLSNILNPALLNHYGKSNLRELSKSQLMELENIKFKVLANIQPFSVINKENILEVLDGNITLSSQQCNAKDSVFADFIEKNNRSPSIDEIRQINVLSYVFNFFDKNN